MLTRPRIILVEDEMDVQNLMKLHLVREGYEVIGVASAEEAIPFLTQEHFDVAVFDWMLPGASGLKLCELFCGKLPILLLTARAEVVDIVLGLSAGADDYVTKPFEIPVFLARISALLRRKPWAKLSSTKQTLKIGNTTLYLESHKCLRDGQEIHLTPMEFKLLSILIENSGRVLSRDKLVDHLQGNDAIVVDRTIDQHIFSLRKKLAHDADFIETIRGVGYRVSYIDS